ncbi:MAG: DNRLRE domain-containing protein [Actinomycetota bacterium]
MDQLDSGLRPFLRPSAARRPMAPGVLLLTVLLLIPAVAVAQDGSPTDDGAGPLVTFDGEEITYGTYRNHCATSADLGPSDCDGERNKNRLRGFSYAGYRAGGVALPAAPVGRTVGIGTEPDELIPEDITAAEHNRTAIRHAILEVDATADAPAAVQLPPGRFYVEEGLTLDRDGVVLRGAGQGPSGTTLMAVQPTRAMGGRSKQPLLLVGRARGDEERFVPIGEEHPITRSFTPSGAFSVTIEDPSAFEVGDHVMIVRTPNQAWIDQLGVNPILIANGQAPWEPSQYRVAHERRVERVGRTRLRLDAPVLEAFYRETGGAAVVKIEPIDRIREVGVEHLRLQSQLGSFDTPDHGDVETHTRNAVVVENAEDAWVSGVTCRTIALHCVKVGWRSRQVTVQDAAAFDWNSVIAGGRRYPFSVNHRASAVLFQRIYSDAARHDAVTGARVPGPNVWLDVYTSEGLSDLGPHHRYATGMLLDNVAGGNMAVRNRGSSGSGHGWSGAQTVFWNVTSAAELIDARYRDTHGGLLWVESPPGAMNIVIGGSSDRPQVGDTAYVHGLNEPLGADVPRSLYLAELQARKGIAGVEAVTTTAQRRGTIYDLLNSWAGSGPMPDVRPSELTLHADDDVYVAGGSSSSSGHEVDAGRRATERLVVSVPQGHTPNGPGRRSGAAAVDGLARSLLRFDVGGVDRTAVERATLTLHVAEVDTVGGAPMRVRVDASASDAAWNENVVSFDALPPLGPSVTVADVAIGAVGEISIDLTEYLRIATGEQITLELVGVGAGGVVVDSSESVRPPQLHITRSAQ